MKKRTYNIRLKKAILPVLTILLFSTISVSAINYDSISQKNGIPLQNNNNRITSDTMAFVLTTDYSSSSFSVINVQNPDNVEKDISSTHGDDEVRYYNGKAYILNRWGYDLIEVFDVKNNFEKINEFSTGADTNPQDIAFISEQKAYVTCYDTTDLLIVNPTTGEHLGSIDLSEYADDDGIPEMHKMVEFKFFKKSRVYVTIQRLDRNNYFAPTDKSYIVEIDGDNDAIIRTIQLTQVNPSSAPVLDGIHILVGETGNWDDAEDGGIERINIFTNEAEGFIVDEAELGGNIIDFDIYPKYSGFKGMILSILDSYLGIRLLNRNICTIVSDLSFTTTLMSYNLNEDVTTELFPTDGYRLVDLAINDNGELYLGDRNPAEPGIRIFDTTTGEQVTSAPIDVGSFPPVHITFLSP